MQSTWIERETIIPGEKGRGRGMRSMPLGNEMGGTFISAFCCKGKGKPVRRKLFKDAAL